MTTTVFSPETQHGYNTNRNHGRRLRFYGMEDESTSSTLMDSPQKKRTNRDCTEMKPQHDFFERLESEIRQLNAISEELDSTVGKTSPREPASNRNRPTYGNYDILPPPIPVNLTKNGQRCNSVAKRVDLIEGLFRNEHQSGDRGPTVQHYKRRFTSSYVNTRPQFIDLRGGGTRIEKTNGENQSQPPENPVSIHTDPDKTENMSGPPRIYNDHILRLNIPFTPGPSTTAQTDETTSPGKEKVPRADDKGGDQSFLSLPSPPNTELSWTFDTPDQNTENDASGEDFELPPPPVTRKLRNNGGDCPLPPAHGIRVQVQESGPRFCKVHNRFAVKENIPPRSGSLGSGIGSGRNRLDSIGLKIENLLQSLEHHNQRIESLLEASQRINEACRRPEEHVREPIEDIYYRDNSPSTSRESILTTKDKRGKAGLFSCIR